MKLKLRLLCLIIASFFKERVSVLEENVLNLRVLPNDIDFVRISNDRYFALMDLGRFDITFRGGLLSTFINKAVVSYGTRIDNSVSPPPLVISKVPPSLTGNLLGLRVDLDRASLRKKEPHYRNWNRQGRNDRPRGHRADFRGSGCRRRTADSASGTLDRGRFIGYRRADKNDAALSDGRLFNYRSHARPL